MFVDFMLDVWEANRDQDAIIWQGRSYSYGWLADRFAEWRDRITAEGLAPSTVVILEADFSPNAIALFLAFVESACVLVPLTESVRAKRSEFLNTVKAEVVFQIDANDEVRITRLPNPRASHPLYDELRSRNHPGLVLFSSGSTGESKAALHDLVPLLDKFKTPRQSRRTVTFLLYDHIGGVNTMLHTLANAGCIVTVSERTPDEVLAAVARYRVELLPTSPTFLNLVLLSEAYKRHDLSLLKTITYGTEPMPEYTLKRCRELFPWIRFQQTYGLSELGILRSKSKDSNSLWVKVGGEGFETRVVDGVLQIKARSAMLGYLNAPSPFTADGWFDTGDAVEVDGPYLKILGRTSEIINVGGEKVYPAEVESVIQEVDGVADAVVYGEKNLITGSIVCADISPAGDLDEAARKRLISEVKSHCRSSLRSYQIPMRVNVVFAPQHSERFKKSRT